VTDDRSPPSLQRLEAAPALASWFSAHITAVALVTERSTQRSWGVHIPVQRSQQQLAEVQREVDRALEDAAAAG
jgi:hypothetical protein